MQGAPRHLLGPRPAAATAQEASPARPGDQHHLPHRAAPTLRGERPARLSETKTRSPGPASPLCHPIRAGSFRTAPPRTPIRVQEEYGHAPSHPSNRGPERSASWWGEIGRGAEPRGPEPRANPGSAAAAAQAPARDSGRPAGRAPRPRSGPGSWARAGSVLRPLRLTVGARRPRGVCSTGEFRDAELKLGDRPPSRCPLYTSGPSTVPLCSRCCAQTASSKQSPLGQ